ncbi:MAG: alpha/beta hydrolase-fold protein, partial [Phycisphaerales bacterium]|nr:alpha/beta hydrolase-fold protein [Phycisphaerales bacterium]
MITRLILLLLLSTPASGDTPAATPTRFLVGMNDTLAEPYTGRVYVMLTTLKRQEPRRGPDWFNPEPFFALDVSKWNGDEPLVLDATSLGHPWALDALPEAEWTMQAVLRGSDTSQIGTGPGTRYSLPTTRAIGPRSGDVALTIDQVERPRPLPEIDGIEWVELESPMLTAALGQPTKHRAGVMPPADFDPDADRTWPTVYVIGGFPGTLDGAAMTKWMWGSTLISKECFIVHLEAESTTGHHVFADSPGNGPRSTALVKEFIPHLESEWPLRPEPSGRLLTGHSSGGWSSLWLQLNWPDVFGGTWSTAPDPVDFRDFQRINIYAESANAFVEPSGDRHPVARMGRNRYIWYDDFVGMEAVMGDGGQIRSFDWTFSPLDEHGQPMRLIDSDSGAIDPDVAAAWRPYDINLFVQEHWPVIGPKVAGKIHIIGGSLDTFYLEGAVELLHETLQSLGSDADVQIIEGADHSNFMNNRRRKRIAQQMVET